MNEQRIQGCLAAFLMVLVAGAVVFLFLRDTPPSNKELVSLVIGVLLGSLKDVYSYYFGATRSADRKDEMMHAALRVPAQSPAAPVSSPPPLPAVKDDP